MDNPIVLTPGNNQSPDADDLEEQKLLETNPHLSRKETRQIVTPYAFFVSDALLGTPLARPFRRGFALSIDMLLVAMLTQVSSLVLAAVAAFTFFRAGNRLKTKKRFNGVRIFLRLLVALLLFVVAMGIVDSGNEDDRNSADTYSSEMDYSDTEEVIVGAQVVAVTAKYLVETSALIQQIKNNECAPADTCIQELAEKLFKDVSDIGLNTSSANSMLKSYVGAAAEVLDEQEIQQLQDYFKQQTQALNDTSVADSQPSQATKVSPENVPDKDELDQFIDDTVNESMKSTNGIIDWVESVVDDLGLGFGWAAFYFSVFTAWWKGQTPGKKLMGIKVIKLDNNPLNLWESFGRYGGYGAGFATGLLGFLQVFWDPNRQAIQDKISETLVIDTRRPKVPFNKEQAS